MFFAYASPMHSPDDGEPFAVVQSAPASAVAAPVFMAVGGMMPLFGRYGAWLEPAACRRLQRPVSPCLRCRRSAVRIRRWKVGHCR